MPNAAKIALCVAGLFVLMVGTQMLAARVNSQYISHQLGKQIQSTYGY